MGSVFSKKKKKKNIITDFTKLTIPSDFKLIKIATYNINLKNTANIDNKIRDIIFYLDTNNKNKSHDIICLQGINDIASFYKLVKQINIYAKYKGIKFYFAPLYDLDNNSDISYDSKSNNKSTQIYNFDNSNKNKRFSRVISENFSSTTKNSKKIEVQNIIISKYPIVNNIIYSDLDVDYDIDDIIGIRSVVGVNISINGNIISLYNTRLSDDIKQVNIINNNMRSEQLKKIFYIIEKNKFDLNLLKNYSKTDIHFLIGSLNINEINNSNHHSTIDNINPEFLHLMQQYRCFDIFRHMNNNNDPGYTNTSRERVDYILFLFTNDLYDKNNIFNKKIVKIRNSKDILKLIFKRYRIYFFDVDVITDAILTHGTSNFPVETVFMISKQKN